MKNIVSIIWHAPGRTWAAMIKAASITLWWRFGAVVMVTGLVAGLIWIIWKGPWPEEAWRVRLDWLGFNSMAAWFVIVIGIVALMDFRLNFRASRQGIEANMAGEHDDPPPVLTTTTTTTTAVKPERSLEDPA